MPANPPRYTVTLPEDEVTVAGPASLESLIKVANIASGINPVVIRDHGRIIIRARGGKAWWVRECEACKGSFASSVCQTCSATGLVEDRPC